MKILITGNKGFVGRYFTEELSELPNVNITGVGVSSNGIANTITVRAKDFFRNVGL